jgi:hypothetical protein
VSQRDCDHFKGLIALLAVSRLPAHERDGLLAHLEGCRDCREDERELMQLSALLHDVDLAQLDGEEMPPGLSAKVLSRLGAEADRVRRRRSLRYALAGIAAAGVAALSLALSLGGASGARSGPSRSVVLTGERRVHATMRLTPEAWGTSVQIDESGQPGGRVLWVSMRTTSGKWWEVGTYRSVAGRAVHVEMACALNLSHIRSVWIEDSAGHVLLHAYLA